jgi:hypothetical protein
MKKFYLRLALVSLLSIGSTVLAQNTPRESSGAGTISDAAQQAKERDIRRMLELTGAGKIGVQMMNQMFDAMRRASPRVPDSVWQELRTEFATDFSAEKIVELNVPIYAKHYTDGEIKQLIAFYQSPLGKKVVAVTPLIVQEGYAVGAARARIIISRIIERLRQKGYAPPPTT